MVDSEGQLFYEDVEAGMEIPLLRKKPGVIQLFMYSAVIRNYHRIHYDQAFARSEQHQDVLIQGALQGNFLAQMLSNWVGDLGHIKKISYSNRGSATPGDELTCSGKVKGKWEEKGELLVECDIWEKNQRGEVLVPGSAVVALPSRENNT